MAWLPQLRYAACLRRERCQGWLPAWPSPTVLAQVRRAIAACFPRRKQTYNEGFCKELS
jgi:hypothetical protein